MKKLIFFIVVAIIATSCSLFVEPEKDGKKVAAWGDTEEVVPIQEEEYIEKLYHVTYTTVSTDSSYWYVVLDEKKKDGGTTTWHGTVELASPYFDFGEAYSQFGKIDETSKGWFKFIMQINKESVETFSDYNHIIYKEEK